MVSRGALRTVLESAKKQSLEPWRGIVYPTDGSGNRAGHLRLSGDAVKGGPRDLQQCARRMLAAQLSDWPNLA